MTSPKGAEARHQGARVAEEEGEEDVGQAQQDGGEADGRQARQAHGEPQVTERPAVRQGERSQGQGREAGGRAAGEAPKGTERGGFRGQAKRGKFHQQEIGILK